ncbi:MULTISPECIES: nitroreductase/quinone reductase family protein [unclassified Streptomyces]|uniref:nitroreductase/quinone reductase family protein n=1 Tax=unclassified Streptomyces TaxID=2593676 RepID=UPI0035DE74DF
MTDQHPSPAAFNQQVIEEFRANGGAVGGMFEGAPLVLLTTTGARTGRPRTNPAVYAHDGTRILVFASNAGGPRHPDWYRNLLADPRVTVEAAAGGGAVETYAATAVPLVGAERDRLYQEQCDRDPAFSAYQAGTTRVIPVVALHRLDLSDRERNRALAAYLSRVHRELREELAVLREEVDAGLAVQAPAAPHDPVRPAPSLGKRLAVHCLAFCDSLHTHHTGEDGAFTVFETQFPRLAPVIARLREEHRTVARVLHDIEALLARLSSRTAAGDAETLRTELARLSAELEAHFSREEQYLLPALTGDDGGSLAT